MMESRVLDRIVLYVALGIVYALICLALGQRSADKRKLLMHTSLWGGIGALALGLLLVAFSDSTLANELTSRRSLLGLALMLLTASSLLSLLRRRDLK
jgi:hypothetical protein